MAVHYSGTNLVVVFGAVDISGYARSVDINETMSDGDIDVTHKGDTSRQYVDGIDEYATEVSITVVDIYDALTEYGTYGLNSQDTLFIYPRGVTHTYPELTLQAAELNARTETIPYEGAVEVTLTFRAKNTLTRGTWASA